MGTYEAAGDEHLWFPLAWSPLVHALPKEELHRA
jgi:hypothetical protein